MDKFKSMMAGNERLVITYWIWGVIGTTVVSFALGFIGGLLGLPLMAAPLLTLVYWVPVAIGIWKSSDNYKGNSLWAILAKVAVVLGLISQLYM
ncbi:MAG: hypothetical protein ACTSU8_00855, partial [Alphaproteobacteria bacterium]